MYFTQIATVVAIAAGAAASPVARQNSGQATFYQANGGTGSCGQQLSNSQMGVAVSSNMGCTSMCGQNVQIESNGQTVSAPVVDCCPSCESNHIDLLPKVFESLGISQSEGVAPVTFSFN
ncbi:hypothetical protein E3P92_00729 [Wallemia ichthyophaga]|uniref:RlpA-like protein double-psi beta-barrel domain-containing protein n=2 Tax=Wallemia ichthyophaga TaxID=245174 RepID=A0A4T0ISG0_WALIC|nr:uncharacterized protein J056_003960 [Wallemia ichthyophaga EXF-994]TIA75529.1 hypothetical protein E3P91_00337 [Wallemia ichthyophaga]EOR01724.1 hypothetical protein J056_003960 [Wallemia ichthyophaga EXF-994]TIA83521.1 hypothetical protein E3P98_00709 [Wallemia ichthyophaga]TIA93841.1 hypothetical protein E3P97_00634 [Wallemia ichthyophaga]TIB01545.1 hypothetical protein E3P96_02377 [Wallemia ichthyophaga]